MSILQVQSVLTDQRVLILGDIEGARNDNGAEE